MRKYRYKKIREGLVGHWRPSRGPTGITLIDSVRGNHGTLTNGPTWTPSAGGGNGGYALQFDGSNDYVTVSAPAQSTRWTFGCWYYWDSSSTANFRDIAYFGSAGVFPFRDTTPFFRFWTGSVAYDTTNFLTYNSWNLFYYTADGTNLRLYGNGNLVSSFAFTGTLPALTTFGTNATRTWWGLLDDIQLYSRDLSASEIRTLYTAGRGALDRRVKKTIVRGVSLAPSSFKAAWTLGSNLVLGI